MADKIVPPRRGEILTGKGIGTTRFMEYLERTATTVNEQSDTDDTENTIAASPAALASVMKELDDIQIELASVGSTSVMLARVFKRLADLELAANGNDQAAISALEKSTFDRRYALLVG